LNLLLKLAGTIVLAAGMGVPALAQTVTVPGQSTTATYMDYMKTVYARAAGSDMIQIGLTAFDKDFNLTPIAAESWSQSADGLTWTFKIRPELNWSDGEPLTAEDFVFALQHAATTGYDFAWYWSFAGGIKNWDDVTAGKADVSTLGLKAVDDKTLEVTTTAPKPYLPSVVSLWYPVPKHQFDKYGEEWSTNVETIVSSGPWLVKEWVKSNNNVTLAKNPDYKGPWIPQIDEVVLDSSLGLPEVGVPAFLAGDVDMTSLNTGQVAMMRSRYADQIHTNPVFATQYIAFDLEKAPFDNADVRRAFYYAINRDELTSTVLKDIAIPAHSILPPGFPGYSENVAKQAVFDPAKAKELMAKAGYPDGKGFPDIEIWFREEGGYNGAILSPMAQYLQAQFKDILGITMNIKMMPGKDWMEGMLARKNNIYLSPYEYDYLDPSNFYGLFYNGGRHTYHIAAYDDLVKQADSAPSWDERVKLYEQAEQVMIDQGLIVPLTHPVTMNVVSDKLGGDAMTPNKQGFYPNWSGYVYTHLTKN
jgi:oligopeptide transport system substrate-binding protein